MQYRIPQEKQTSSNHTGQPSAAAGWEQKVMHDALMASYQEQRRNRFWRNIWRSVWTLMILSVAVHSCSGSDGTSQFAKPGEHTAVISLNGAIGNSYDEDQVAMLRDSLEAAYSSSGVKGIIIRANSPGGSPVVSNIAFNEIRRLKAEHKNIPLYVVTEDVCASGCYYIAAAADKIYADPSSVVGSIGVIGGGFDLTGLMDKMGIKRRLKTAGSNKGMGDPFTPETPEQTKIWESMLADIHQEFIKSVKLGRGGRLKDKENPDVFSGRVYTGNEAKKIGLIDDYGSVYSVSRDVIKAPVLVDYSQEDNFRKLLSRSLRSETSALIESIGNRIW